MPKQTAVEQAEQAPDVIVTRRDALEAEREQLTAELDDIGGTDVDHIVGEISQRRIRIDALGVAIANLQNDVAAAETALQDARNAEAMKRHDAAQRAMWSAVNDALAMLDSCVASMDQAAVAEGEAAMQKRIFESNSVHRPQLAHVAEHLRKQYADLSQWAARHN